jgi:hypothetical protein
MKKITFYLVAMLFLGTMATGQPNQPPVANAGPDFTVQGPLLYYGTTEFYQGLDKFLKVDGSASYDPDGDALTYQWNVLQGYVYRATTNAAVFTADEVYVGNCKLELVVSDGQTESRDTVNVTIALDPNIAKGKTATASSVESSSYPASYANDGKMNTRWSSKFADNQWIMFDLGEASFIYAFSLKWEAAYAKTWQIQVSNDKVTWTDAYCIPPVNKDDIVYFVYEGKTDFIQIHSCRYIKVLCKTRATAYGFSLWEAEVYGRSVNSAPIAEAGQNMTYHSPFFDLIGDASTDPNGDLIKATWTKISGPACNITKYENIIPASLLLPADYLRSRVTNALPGTYVFQVSVSDGAKSSTDQVTITVPSTTNIALNKPAFTSSIESSSYTAAKVNDGRIDSRWSSVFSDNQFIYIDLQKEYDIYSLILKWEASYARTGYIQYSSDNVLWNNWFSFEMSSPAYIYANNEKPWGTDFSARYLKVNCQERATIYGFSLWEIEVYGAETGLKSERLINQEKEVRLSLFPNPASDDLTIVGADNDTKYSVFNSSGQMVEKGIGSQVNISKLSQGIYVLKSDKFTGKFVKK